MTQNENSRLSANSAGGNAGYSSARSRDPSAKDPNSKDPCHAYWFGSGCRYGDKCWKSHTSTQFPSKIKTNKKRDQRMVQIEIKSHGKSDVRHVVHRTYDHPQRAIRGDLKSYQCVQRGTNPNKSDESDDDEKDEYDEKANETHQNPNAVMKKNRKKMKSKKMAFGLNRWRQTYYKFDVDAIPKGSIGAVWVGQQGVDNEVKYDALFDTGSTLCTCTPSFAQRIVNETYWQIQSIYAPFNVENGGRTDELFSGDHLLLPMRIPNTHKFVEMEFFISPHDDVPMDLIIGSPDMEELGVSLAFKATDDLLIFSHKMRSIPASDQKETAAQIIDKLCQSELDDITFAKVDFTDFPSQKAGKKMIVATQRKPTSFAMNRFTAKCQTEKTPNNTQSDTHSENKCEDREDGQNYDSDQTVFIDDDDEMTETAADEDGIRCFAPKIPTI